MLKYEAHVRFRWHDMETTVEAPSKAEAERKLREELKDSNPGTIWLRAPEEPQAPIDWLKN